MGGVPCAKEVIDNRNALVQQLACMVATILLHQDNSPTYAERDEFIAAGEALAKVAAKIEARIGGGQ